MEKEIRIPINKNKYILFLILGGIFVLISFLAILNRNASMGVFGIMILSVSIMFWSIVLFFLLKLLRNKNGLIISEKGIANHFSLFKETIAWEDLESVYIKKSLGTQFLVLIVKNPEDYINRVKGTWTKKILRRNYRKLGSPIYTNDSFKISLSDLEKLIISEYQKYIKQ
ncbi:STM3941 family protein [Riemerella columbipharyngis]|uniref:PH domain-containing protein n=1 Tax=Riemerella columbipharyngis TaxID=1071918 RepID=A0A1G7F4T2_9FLAO|nr:STM3941 family protein [Riemerella columbipharyngis]SDE70953.1 hypothetical protein SAMN05421544_11924 [Riemerella columbipharyngis]